MLVKSYADEILGECTLQRWPRKPGFDRKNRRERSRGRRRTLWMNSLQEWLGERRADRADHHTLKTPGSNLTRKGSIGAKLHSGSRMTRKSVSFPQT